ncbi:MAG: HD domain-containing protein [Candidatus Uhrbacteria bacterium]|nr:HD domain-containing protein [Candidatus Uhrbacteria bacterium]
MSERRTFQEYHTKRFSSRDSSGSERAPHETLDDGTKIFRGHDPESFSFYLERIQGERAVEAFKLVLTVAQTIKELGGRALLVGGSVRDEVLGKPSKDFDIEVYGIDPAKLENILAKHGRVDSVGRAFGVLKLLPVGGFDLDVSIPRKDSKVREGDGRFDVDFDPDMSILEAARRRDFTFNALAKDPLTGEIFDAFGGIEDLRHRQLRVTDKERFVDDPLRVLRAAQFIARFGLRPDEPSLELIRATVPSMDRLSVERFATEWMKLLTKADRPSAGLHALHEFGVVERFYPELLSLQATPQEFEWHPEGDVWTHTLMVVDEAARVARRHELEGARHRYLMFAALCHDLGKPATTKFEDGRWRSKAHESAGEEPTRSLLLRLGVKKDEIETIVGLVKEHLWPGMMYRFHQKGERVTEGAFRRAAKRLAPATIQDLTYVMEADANGRGPFLHPDLPDQLLLPFPDQAGAWAREQARVFGVDRQTPPPVLQGRDLIGFGLKPGCQFGEIISRAEALRDEGVAREQILLALDGVKTPKEAMERLTSIM